jgi:uncharacterized repeat protein (TIGR03803 family)
MNRLEPLCRRDNRLAPRRADRAGNLYGTTRNGGASKKGVVFKRTGTGFGVIPISAFSCTFEIALLSWPQSTNYVAALIYDNDKQK